MLRIMFIDDDPKSVVDAVELLQENFAGLKIDTMNFEQGKESIRSFRPDMIVLDIWKGSIRDSEPEGSTIYDALWAEQFCPIIVYSADSEKVDRRTRRATLW